MPQKQLPNPSLARHQSSLTSCRVTILLGRLQTILAIGALVVERRDTLEFVSQLRQVFRVADIGIAAQHIFGSAGGFLTDEIATAGYTVLQGDALDGDTTVLEDHLATSGVDRMELDGEAQVVGVELYLMFQFRPQCLGSMHMKGRNASHESEGGDHTNESEAMVAMKMGDEDMPQFGKAHPAPAKLHLGALSTVEHQNLLAHLDDLRRGVMTQGGKRTSTTQNMNLKGIHGH